jgi:hypothetical protein
MGAHMNTLLMAAAYVFVPVVIPGASFMANFSGPNDKGQIVVNPDIGSGIYQDGTFTPLPPPPTGSYITGLGINNAGTVAGVAYTAPDFLEQGFILQGSNYRFFSRPGWPNTEPRGIGNSGLVTGWSVDYDTGLSAGFVYDPRTDTFTDATPPGSDFTIVQGINKAGVISGNGHDANGSYAFIWQQGTFTKIKGGTVPFIDTFLVNNERGRARGINDAGVIVGFTDSAGFVGNAVGGYQLLKVPGAATTGTGATFCAGINNSGQVTCGFIDFDAGTFRAFIGTPRDGGDHDDQGKEDSR